MMGIEAVKSSTPAPCRKMIKDALKIMMNGTEEEVIDFIEQSRKDFKKLPPEDIAFPRSASDVVKYQAHSTIYAKGTPIHIRGALLYNHYIKCVFNCCTTWGRSRRLHCFNAHHL